MHQWHCFPNDCARRRNSSEQTSGGGPSEVVIVSHWRLLDSYAGTMGCGCVIAIRVVPERDGAD